MPADVSADGGMYAYARHPPAQPTDTTGTGLTPNRSRKQVLKPRSTPAPVQGSVQGARECLLSPPRGCYPGYNCRKSYRTCPIGQVHFIR